MRPTATALASTLARAATLVLAVGCADRDTDAPDGDAAPDAAVPPTGGDGLPSADADIPMRFQGRFAADTAACDASGHASQLEIDADAIAFHESSGPVTGVASGPSDITITAELTGEGETREATYRFRLSDDGDMLTDLEGGMERVRCE